MKYIMGRKNMSVIVDKRSEVNKLKKEGFILQGYARDYEHARQKVMEAVKRAGYKHLEEISGEHNTHNF